MSQPTSLHTATPIPAVSLTQRKPFSRRRWIRNRLLLLLALYAIWCTTLFLLQTWLIYPRGHTRRVLSDEKIPKYVQHWWLADGLPAAQAATTPHVEAYFIPAVPSEPAADSTTATTPDRKPLVVYFHGNADSLDRCLDSVRIWRNKGYNVLIPEYRGYGRCNGTPSQQVIVDDSLIFIKRALALPGVDTSRVLFHGRSLGSGVAAQVSLHIKPRAIIIESGFTSIASYAVRFGVPTFVLNSPFRTDRALGEMPDPPPTLILHSREDTVVPYAHGERLHALIRGSEMHTFTGGHNDGIENLPDVLQRLDKFVLRAGIQSSPSAAEQEAVPK